MRGNMIGGGGGAVDIDGLTAIAEKVVAGYLFYGAGSEDEQTGSMPDIGAVDEAQDLLYNQGAGLIRVGMTPGAHITNGDMGRPEVTVPQASLASLIGLVASAIAYGTTIAGVAGNYSGDSTINAAGILAGLVGYGKGQRIVGEMPNNGAVNQTIAAGAKYDIPVGYHNGSGKVTAQDLASQTAGNATAAQILAGMIAWVNGSKVTGTMPNNGAAGKSDLGAGATYTIPAGYHNGSGKVIAKTLKAQTPGNAAAGDILNTKKAWVEGEEVNGTMVNQGAAGKPDLDAGATYTIPAGYHNGQGKVTAKDLASQTAGNATAAQILAGMIAWVGGQKITGNIQSQAAQTIYPSTSDQIVASGKYLSEAQTIKAVTTQNIVAANIKKGVVVKVGDAASAGRIKDVTGTYEANDTVIVISANAYCERNGSIKSISNMGMEIPQNAKNASVKFVGMSYFGNTTGKINNVTKMNADSDFQLIDTAFFPVNPGDVLSLVSWVSEYYHDRDTTFAYGTMIVKYST